MSERTMPQKVYRTEINAETWNDRWRLFSFYIKFAFDILLHGKTWMQVTKNTQFVDYRKTIEGVIK